MIQEHILGTITDLSETGELTIKAGAPDIDRAVLRQYRTCEIILDDGRKISPQQRRKVYALLGEIDEYVNGIRTAEGVEEQKRLLKLEFMLKRMSKTERQLFSLADTDVTTAREFITFVIDFIVANDIPTRIPLLEQCEDIGRYVYACLVNKRCCICGVYVYGRSFLKSQNRFIGFSFDLLFFVIVIRSDFFLGIIYRINYINIIFDISKYAFTDTLDIHDLLDISETAVFITVSDYLIGENGADAFKFCKFICSCGV